jgi:lipoprotein-anchoring transpeptidase ErfK/SrfK
LRPDLLPQIVLATGARTDARGRLWYRVEIPMRPNGRLGWVRADGVDLQTVHRSILIQRGLRRLTVYAGRRVLMRTRVAVGATGMETPLGRFYVTAKFKPSEPILGAYAMETSAYSRLSEWPGGGIVGIHGAPMPWLLGQAVSHGCVRVANEAIVRVARLVPPGTFVRIVG